MNKIFLKVLWTYLSNTLKNTLNLIHVNCVLYTVEKYSFLIQGKQWKSKKFSKIVLIDIEAIYEKQTLQHCNL